MLSIPYYLARFFGRSLTAPVSCYAPNLSCQNPKEKSEAMLNASLPQRPAKPSRLRDALQTRFLFFLPQHNTVATRQILQHLALHKSVCLHHLFYGRALGVTDLKNQPALAGQ